MSFFSLQECIQFVWCSMRSYASDCEWQRSVTSLAISEVDIWSWPGFPPIIRIPNRPAHKTKTSKNNWKHKKIEHIDMKSLKIQQSGKRYGCEVFRGENSIGSNVYPDPSDLIVILWQWFSHDRDPKTIQIKVWISSKTDLIQFWFNIGHPKFNENYHSNKK